MERRYYKESSVEEVLNSLSNEEMLQYMDYGMNMLKNYELFPERMDNDIKEMSLCVEILLKRMEQDDNRTI